MSGFLPIPRDFFTQAFWSEKRSFSKAEAYLDLLHFAAYAPSERIISGKLIELDEGECIASVRFLAERWGWGKDKAAQFMQTLETRHYIRRVVRQGETAVILCRYRDGRSQTDARPDSKPDRDTDTDQTNNKKVKKGRREQGSLAVTNELTDQFPTEIANEMQLIIDSINQLAPPWKRRPHLGFQEMIDLQTNLKAFRQLEEGDWIQLKEYLRQNFDEEMMAKHKFFQPTQRSMFIRAISDILQHADRWALVTKWKRP